MITQTKRNAIRQRIHDRIRRKLAGTGERPRLNVYRSLNHIYAQVIDDQKGETLVSASTLGLKSKTGGNVAAAKEIGKAVAELPSSKGSRRWSSIAAATFITGGSRRWPMRPARPAWNSKNREQGSGISEIAATGIFN